MEKGVSISGVAIRDLAWKDDRLVVLEENDHILRRFGQVDVVMLAPGISLDTHRTGGADEVWALLTGEAFLQLTDRRQDSPTVDQTMEMELKDDAPQIVLIPFGVFAQISGQRAGILLRITTHADVLYPEDTVFSEDGE